MKRKVVVIDDSYYMRTIIKNILNDAGYSVVGEAANGEQAMALADDTNPDLVTLDLILPDSTGLDVLKKLKKEHPETKVVVVSAVGQEAVVKQAMDLGAVAYIVKPFAEDKVVEIVNDALA